MAIDLGVDPRDIERQVSESDLRKSAELIESAPLYIVDNPSTDIDMIRKTCFKLQEDKKLGLVVIDCLELINNGDGMEDRSVKLRNLKSFTRKINCPVLVLSELRYSTLKSLLDQSQSEEVPEIDDSQKYPDEMMLLYPELYVRGSEVVRKEAELIIINQREYKGRVRLLMDSGDLSFKNLS